MKPPLTRTAFFAATLLAGASFLPAQAATPELAFYPAKAWSVGAAAGEVGEQCAIQNEFNNGFLLRLNGSKNVVQDMQLDFRQRIFDDNQPYRVTMDVPGQIHAVMDAVTQGGNVLKIDMAADQNFYEALKNGGVLDLDIEGNQFRFYMTGFNTQAGWFESCMADSTTAPEAPDIIVPTNIVAPAMMVDEPAPAEEIQIVEVQEEDQVAQMQDIPVPEEVMYEQPAPAPMLISEATPRKVEVESTPDTREALIADLEDFMTPIPEPEEKDEVVVLTSQPEPFAEDTAILSAPEPEPQPVAPAIEVVKSPEPVVTKETSKIEADFRQIPSPEEIAAKEALEAKLYQLELANRELEEKNRDLDEELQLVMSEKAQKQVSISSDNWNLERATMRFNEAERQLKTLGRQLQRERRACTMEKQELESMLFDPALTEERQMARLADLEEKLAAAEAELETFKGR